MKCILSLALWLIASAHAGYEDTPLGIIVVHVDVKRVGWADIIAYYPKAVLSQDRLKRSSGLLILDSSSESAGEQTQLKVQFDYKRPEASYDKATSKWKTVNEGKNEIVIDPNQLLQLLNDSLSKYGSQGIKARPIPKGLSSPEKISLNLIDIRKNAGDWFAFDFPSSDGMETYTVILQGRPSLESDIEKYNSNDKRADWQSLIYKRLVALHPITFSISRQIPGGKETGNPQKVAGLAILQLKSGSSFVAKLAGQGEAAALFPASVKSLGKESLNLQMNFNQFKENILDTVFSSKNIPSEILPIFSEDEKEPCGYLDRKNPAETKLHVLCSTDPKDTSELVSWIEVDRVPAGKRTQRYRIDFKIGE